MAEWARAARSRGESGRGDRLTLEAGDVHEREDRARHVARRALAARWVHEWRGLPVGDARAARELAYRDARLRSDPARDATEMRLIRWAVGDRKPLLGVCRGFQALNVTDTANSSVKGSAAVNVVARTSGGGGTTGGGTSGGGGGG